MARKVGDLFASLSLKDKEFLVRLGKAVDQSNRSGKQIQKSFDGINFKKLTLGIAGVTAAYYSITRTVGSFIKAAQDAETAENQVSSAMKLTGIYTEQLHSGINRLASQMQKLTIEDDDTTKANIALMQNIGHLSKEVIPEATKAAIGLSRIMKTDTQTAFMLVGRAAAGNTALFTRYGIQLDEAMTKEQKFQEILKRGVAGFEIAKSEIETSAGATKQLSNAFGDLKENLGNVINLGLDPFIEKLKTVITNINNSEGTWAKLKEWTSWRYGGEGWRSMFEGGTGGLNKNEKAMALIRSGNYGGLSEDEIKVLSAIKRGNYYGSNIGGEFATPRKPFPTQFKPMKATERQYSGAQAYKQYGAGITNEQLLQSLQPEWYDQYLKDLRLRQKLALKEMTVDIRDESTNWQLAVKDFATATRDVLADTLFDWFRGEIRGMGDLWRAFASSIGRAAFRGVANYITGGVEGLVARGMGGSSPVAKAAPVIERSGSGSSIIITGNQFTDVNQLTMLMKNVALNAVHEDYKNNGMVRQMVTR